MQRVVLTSSLRAASRRTLAKSTSRAFAAPVLSNTKRAYSSSSSGSGSSYSSGEGLKFLFPLSIVLGTAFALQDRLNISTYSEKIFKSK